MLFALLQCYLLQCYLLQYFLLQYWICYSAICYSNEFACLLQYCSVGFPAFFSYEYTCVCFEPSRILFTTQKTSKSKSKIRTLRWKSSSRNTPEPLPGRNPSRPSSAHSMSSVARSLGNGLFSQAAMVSSTTMIMWRFCSTRGDTNCPVRQKLSPSRQQVTAPCESKTARSFGRRC